jgi:hypothetical protein
MVDSDWPKQMIATDLRISIECLRKHYRDEIRNGKKLFKLYAALAYRDAAFEKQSVASLRQIAEMDAPPRTDGRMPAAPKPEKPVVLGKKEERARVALETATGIFAPSPPPRQSLNGKH